jgi:hypothetical protein
MRRGGPLLFVIGMILMWSLPVNGQGLWVSDTSTGLYPRVGFTSINFDNKIYVFNGGNYQPFASPITQVFDPIAHTWSTVGSGESIALGGFPEGGGIGSLKFNGDIYVVGSDFGNCKPLDSVKRFNPQSNISSWPRVTGKHTHRSVFATCEAEGKLYLLGGQNFSSTCDRKLLASVDVFDPATLTWSELATTGHFTPRAELAACYQNGKIYAIGGYDSSYSETSIVEMLDLATLTWSTPHTIGLFSPRIDLSVTPLNGRIYAIGGDLDVQSYGTVQVLDPSIMRWSQAAPMPTPRYLHSACVLGEKIYVIGGYTPHQILNTVEVFTPQPSEVEAPARDREAVALVPNPTFGNITIRGAAGSIIITNVLGERVLEYSSHHETEANLDLSRLPTGTYFARISAPNGIVVQKIVKE